MWAKAYYNIIENTICEQVIILIEYKNNIEKLSKEGLEIFDILQKKGPITKGQLLLMTNMKLTTLNRIMQPLEDYKLIIETDIGESTGGRKPVLYDVNPRNYYIVGIDISRTYTRIVVTNLKMNVLYEFQFSMTQYCTPERTVETISEALNNSLKELSIGRDMLIGIGIGAVGPLDRKLGIIINPKNFEAPGWSCVPIKEMLEREFNLPVVVDNGANTAVLAEFLYGNGKGFNNIAYFNCGIGIRTGVISAGHIVRTINDAEDAFGHMGIDIDGELCGCGNYGCVECYASIHSIVKKFISSLKKGRFSKVLKQLEQIDFVDICIAAQENDELAREVITEGAVAFGAGLANYINLLSPQFVILSGPLIKNSDIFYRVSTETALKRYYLKDECKIIFNKGDCFKDNAIAIGAASAVIENILKCFQIYK